MFLRSVETFLGTYNERKTPTVYTSDATTLTCRMIFLLGNRYLSLTHDHLLYLSIQK